MTTTPTRTARSASDDAAEHTADKISTTAGAAGAAVRDVFDRAAAAVDDVSDRASAATHDLSRRVEQQPLTSVLLAASAGFVVGLLMVRR